MIGPMYAWQPQDPLVSLSKDLNANQIDEATACIAEDVLFGNDP